MKTNKPYTNKSQQAEKRLAEMLSAIEHAGRDSRRRQKLSDLIDQLAAKDAAIQRHHKRKVWSIAFSAAACIALFVTTIVHLTGMTGSTPADRPLFAGIAIDSIPEPTATADTMTTPTIRRNHTPLITIAETISDEPMQTTEKDTIPPSDTLFIIDEPELLLAETPEDDEKLQNQITSITAPITSVENNENTMSNPQPEPEKKTRRLFRFHRPEASKMDGTMLAINIKL